MLFRSGYFAGTIEQKSSVWLAPVIDVLYKRLGRATTLLAIENGDIEFVPMETVKGRSFGEDTAVIVTEAEDCTQEEIKSLLTRQNGCKMVIEGDIRQSALDRESGLKLAIDLHNKYKSLQIYPANSFSLAYIFALPDCEFARLLQMKTLPFAEAAHPRLEYS